MIGVRYREDVGFEGMCDYCTEWWPIDLAFWWPKQGYRKCRACGRAQTAARVGRLRDDPVVRARHAEAARENAKAKVEVYQPVRDAWYIRNRERILAKKRAAYAAAKASVGLTVRTPMTDEERRARKRETDAYYYTRKRERRNDNQVSLYYQSKFLADTRIVTPEATELRRAARRAYNREWMRNYRAAQKGSAM